MPQPSYRELMDTIDECDTAFAVINICDSLTPQAKTALKEAWAKVQEMKIADKPKSTYAEAVRSEPRSAYNQVKTKKKG